VHPDDLAQTQHLSADSPRNRLARAAALVGSTASTRVYSMAIETVHDKATVYVTAPLLPPTTPALRLLLRLLPYSYYDSY
jgi:hypothetical protein